MPMTEAEREALITDLKQVMCNEYAIDPEPKLISSPVDDGKAEEWSQISPKRLPPGRERYLQQRYFLTERSRAWKYALLGLAVLGAIATGMFYIYDGAKEAAIDGVSEIFGGLSTAEVEEKVNFILEQEQSLRASTALQQLRDLSAISDGRLHVVYGSFTLRFDQSAFNKINHPQAGEYWEAKRPLDDRDLPQLTGMQMSHADGVRVYMSLTDWRDTEMYNPIPSIRVYAEPNPSGVGFDLTCQIMGSTKPSGRRADIRVLVTGPANIFP